MLVEENPRYHDGELFHVLGVVRNGHAGATIHLAPSSYRFHAVRRLGLDTGIRPLGVKGLATIREASGTFGLLAGRRSASSASYPSCWEYLPGGGVEPTPSGGGDPVDVIRRELREETGMDGTVDPVALAILEDPTVGTWEVVFRIMLREAPADRPPGWEHDEWRVVTPETLPDPASDAARALEPLARKVLAACS